MLPGGEESIRPSVPAHARGTRAWLGLSERDLRILALARAKLGAARDFDEAVRALRDAVEEVIPAGRVYFLETTPHGPLVGSIASGVGILPAPSGRILVARRRREGGRDVLGPLTGR